MFQWSGVVLAMLGLVSTGFAQDPWQKHGALIAPGDLPGGFAASLKQMGDRLTSADKAATSISGTLTDASGTRSVQITVQAPGYLRFEDSASSRVLTYDGSRWQGKNGKGGQDDSRVEESLLAHIPDSLFLQLANGGGVRWLGSRFRTDDGKTTNYTGPYWTLYAYSPGGRQGLAPGQALQQSHLIAIDESTGLISEVRIVQRSRKAAQRVTQTKFNNWFQQAGQWYPGEIVRLENGQQALKLTVQQVTTGTQLPKSAFQP